MGFQSAKGRAQLASLRLNRHATLQGWKVSMFSLRLRVAVRRQLRPDVRPHVVGKDCRVGPAWGAQSVNQNLPFVYLEMLS